jgi:hypothetical protein
MALSGNAVMDAELPKKFQQILAVRINRSLTQRQAVNITIITVELENFGRCIPTVIMINIKRMI